MWWWWLRERFGRIPSNEGDGDVVPIPPPHAREPRRCTRNGTTNRRVLVQHKTLLFANLTQHVPPQTTFRVPSSSFST